MTARYAIADAAALIGEPTRAAILLALLDGRALPAGELAREARLSAAATSLHLAKLTQGGFLAVQPEGRHRYYRLANANVAHVLEALGVVATGAPARHSPSPSPCPSPSLSPAKAALRGARTCYDHMAGRVAVVLAQTLQNTRIIRTRGERDYDVTREGAAWLSRELGIDVAALAETRRPLARRCLDWTERRPHLAGALGAAILDRVLAMRWAARVGDTRALRITDRGRAGFTRIGVTRIDE